MDPEKPQRKQDVLRKVKALIQMKKEVPVIVSEVHVKGASITKEDIFEREIQAALKAKTLEGVIEGLKQGISNLEKLDIFHQIDVTLDTPDDPRAPPNAVDIYVNVKEKGRLKAETGTYIGNQEGNVSGSVALRNVFGRGETVQAHVALGTQTRSVFELSFLKPLYGNVNTTLGVAFFKQIQDFSSVNSHDVANQGARLSLNFLSRFGRHTVSYEGLWREVFNVSGNASFKIREEAGHSLKSAVKHVLTVDHRDHPLLPTQGYLLRLTNEYSGIGAGPVFLKNQVEAQVHTSPRKGFVFSGSLQGGSIISGDKKPTVGDRFFLGGPVSVRGFASSGLGPQAVRRTAGLGAMDRKTDALGGDLYWAGGLSVLTPVPIPKLLDNDVVKLHFFANGGNLIQTESGSTFQQGVDQLMSNTDVAVGFGLAVRSTVARLEVNYCVPVYGKNADLKNRRFYVGIGFDFL